MILKSNKSFTRLRKKIRNERRNITADVPEITRTIRKITMNTGTKTGQILETYTYWDYVMKK
jgi:hypothetical protein